MTVLPGPIRQIGYVVTDLDRAMAHWLELGVGPWFVLRGLPMQANYRGEPCETTLSVAWSNSGEMQIELIQQLDDTPSIFTEFLDGHGPGYHQLAYWATDFEATMRRSREGRLAGRLVRWRGIAACASPTSSRQTGRRRSSRSPSSPTRQRSTRSSCMMPRRTGTAAIRSGTCLGG